MPGDWELWKAIRPSHGANLSYEPRATALHVRASWRGISGWGPAPLRRWLQVATDGQEWPEATRGANPPGELPQAALWRAMLDAALRASLGEGDDWKQRAERCASESEAMTRALESTRHDLAAARVQLHALIHSESWHLTAPLRRAGAALRQVFRS